jgi:hypothetical protein
MTRHSDEELEHLYEEVAEQGQPESDDAWKAILDLAAKCENRDPWLRNHAYVAEQLASDFLRLARRPGMPLPDNCVENIAKLVLSLEKPFMASLILKIMLDDLNHPLDALDDCIRMAELKMGAKFTRLTREEEADATVKRLVQDSELSDSQVDQTEARMVLKTLHEEAAKLRETGLRFRELGKSVSEGFLDRLKIRGLPTRELDWYRDSITFCLQMHENPYFAAATMLRLASRDPDPTAGLIELLDVGTEQR